MDDTFWSAWSAVHPASLTAARHAYRQGCAPLGFEPQIGPPGVGWLSHRTGVTPVVVARILRLPATSGAEASPTGSRCWALLTALDQPLRDFCRGYGGRWFVAGWPLLCPWQPELAAAHLLHPLSGGLRPGSSWTATTATAVGGLAVGRDPLGEIGHLAVATGLASAEPYARIAAAETWVKAAVGGRLDPRLAADAIVMGVDCRAFKLNRMAEALEYASPEPPAAIRALASARSTSRLTAAARLLSPRT